MLPDGSRLHVVIPDIAASALGEGGDHHKTLP
jgi:hypothetical protein